MIFKADSGRAVFNQCPRQQTVCLIQSQPKTETKLLPFCILTASNDSNLKGLRRYLDGEEGGRSEPEPEPDFDHYLSLSSIVSFAGRSAAIFLQSFDLSLIVPSKKPHNLKLTQQSIWSKITQELAQWFCLFIAYCIVTLVKEHNAKLGRVVPL